MFSIAVLLLFMFLFFVFFSAVLQLSTSLLSLSSIFRSNSYWLPGAYITFNVLREPLNLTITIIIITTTTYICRIFVLMALSSPAFQLFKLWPMGVGRNSAFNNHFINYLESMRVTSDKLNDICYDNGAWFSS